MASVLPCVGDPSGLHVGVVSSDMGIGAAVGLSGVPGCSAAGDAGNLRSQPEAPCTDTTLDPGAAFISDIGKDRNYSAPDDASGSGMSKVFGCIAQLGTGGCGFGQPLAALARALGADGQPPPAANAGFLRPDAYLGIVLISNEDDCSVPGISPASVLFSSMDPVDGPLTHYRCNHAGHLCQDPQDPSGSWAAPPLEPPADAPPVDGVPTASLANCTSNETGELTPVSQLIAGIRSLKADPDHQILVSAVVGPPAPYAVQWVPGASGPQVAPSCGTRNADGSGAYGEPGVRLTQFTNGFLNSVTGSICDPSYVDVMTPYCSRLAYDRRPPCLPTDIQSKTDAAGNTYPDCVVTENLNTAGGTQEIPIPPCLGPPGSAACWSLGAPTPGCSGPSFTVQNEPVGPDPAHYASTVTVSCQLTPPPAPADAGACAD